MMSIYNMSIIDPHYHLWDLENNYYPWLTDKKREDLWIGDYSSLQKSYLIQDYFTDIQNQHVVKSVHIQAEYDPQNPVGEIEWLQSVADTFEYPHGIVAYANFSDRNIEDVLQAHCQYPNMRGIRMLLNWHDNTTYRVADRPDYFTDSEWLRGFSLLAKYNLSFDLHINYNQLADAAKVASDFPDIQIILNHTGLPIDKSPEGVTVWKENMHMLASNSNVAVKISGLGTLDHHWTEESIKPFVLNTIQIFGTSRCMFASNFPVDKLYSPYDTLLETFKHIVSDFPLNEQKQLFFENAQKYYRL